MTFWIENLWREAAGERFDMDLADVARGWTWRVAEGRR